MRAGYFAEQEELIEDLEKYDEKLKQFYEGLQLLHKDPDKSVKLIKDSLEYFEEFSEKHDKKDKTSSSIDLEETREHLENYFENNDFRDRFKHLENLNLSNYDFGFSKGKDKKRDKGGWWTITNYQFGTDFEPIDMGNLFDLAESVANPGTGSGSSQNTANDSDRSDFYEFVDNLDMSGFKDYTD